jgi:hypothetical protein
LIVENERTNRVWELITLPSALTSRCCVALALRCCGTGSLDGVRGRTQLVRRDMGDDGGLAGGVRGMPGCPRRSLAAPMAWPPAARACIIFTSPRTQARACSIA